MTLEKEIVEGNKIIAEFMEYKLIDTGRPFYKKGWFFHGEDTLEKYPPLYKLLESNDEDKLWFHSSWDWLMPACKKFDELEVPGSPLKIRRKYEDCCDKIDHKVALYEIKPVWEALVEAIQWYNTHQPI